MTSKSKKPVENAPRVQPAKPLTEEEKKFKIMQFLQQKREQFSINILCNMIQGEIDNLISNSNAPSAIVKMSIKMADQLLEMLYPIKEEENK